MQAYFYLGCSEFQESAPYYKNEGQSCCWGKTGDWCTEATFISVSMHLNILKPLPLRRNYKPKHQFTLFEIQGAGTDSLEKLSTFVVYNSAFLNSPLLWSGLVLQPKAARPSLLVAPGLVLPVPSASPALTGEYHQNSFHFFFSLHRPAW